MANDGVSTDNMNGFYKFGFRYYTAISGANDNIDRSKPFLYDQYGFATGGSPLRHSGASCTGVP
jgi:hypothetical protein